VNHNTFLFDYHLNKKAGLLKLFIRKIRAEKKAEMATLFGANMQEVIASLCKRYKINRGSGAESEEKVSALFVNSESFLEL
jgi:ribosome biogenesis protein Nip4